MKLVWALMSEYSGEGGGEVERCYINQKRAEQDLNMLQNTATKSYKLFQVLLVEDSGIVTDWFSGESI